MRPYSTTQGQSEQLKINGHIPNTRGECFKLKDILQQQHMAEHLQGLRRRRKRCMLKKWPHDGSHQNRKGQGRQQRQAQAQVSAPQTLKELKVCLCQAFGPRLGTQVACDHQENLNRQWPMVKQKTHQSWHLQCHDI